MIENYNELSMMQFSLVFIEFYIFPSISQDSLSEKDGVLARVNLELQKAQVKKGFCPSVHFLSKSS